MKSIPVIILSILLMSYTFQQKNKDTILNTEISSVKVFLNSAEIQRQSDINLNKGNTIIVFTGISSSIDEKSLRVNIVSNNVKINSIKIDKIQNNYSSNKQWNTINNKLLEKNKQISQINIEINTLKKSLKFYDSNMKIGGNNPVSFNTINKTEALFRNKIKSIYQNIDSLEEKINKINKIKKNIIELLDKIEDKLDKTNREIRISVTSKNNISTTVNIRYLVNNAIWKPLYNIKANSNDNMLDFEYQAQIYNDTGNDWNNKKLTLALVDLSEDISRPKLKPWVLSDSNYDNSSSEGKLYNYKGNYNTNNNNQYDLVSVNDLNIEFALKETHNVPSDATPHTIDIKKFKKEVEYYNLSIPKIKEGVFVIAKIKDWQKMGLIDGKCNIYYNNEYQGQIILDTKQIGNTLELSVGKNMSSKVTKRKLSNKSKKNFIGTYISEEIVYEFIAKNTNNKSINFELRDQLPISNFKNIVVTPLELNNAKLNNQNGLLTWKISLKPGKSKKFIFSFKVKYPKDSRNLLKINRKKIYSPRFF